MNVRMWKRKDDMYMYSPARIVNIYIPRKDKKVTKGRGRADANSMRIKIQLRQKKRMKRGRMNKKGWLCRLTIEEEKLRALP